MNDRKAAIPKAHKSTYQWIFDDQDSSISFTHWLRQGSGVYWVSGKAGSGKSTLMKFILEDPRTILALNEWSPNASLLGYFVWNSGFHMQRNLKGLLCSLLHQLLTASAETNEDTFLSQVQQVSKSNPTAKQRHEDWSVTELEEALKQAFTMQDKRICIFIDGLDELDQNEKFLPSIRLITTLSTMDGMKICVSSRPEALLAKALDRFPKLRVQDFNGPDIRKYAVDVIKEYVSVMMPMEDTQHQRFNRLIDAVVNKADGVFLWVHLALESICRGLSYDDDWETLQKRLSLLPADLKRLYRDMWRRLNPDFELYLPDAANLLNAALLLFGELELLAEPQPSVLDLILSTNNTLQSSIVDRNQIPPNEHLAKDCVEVMQRARVRCAGFLEFSPYPPNKVAAESGVGRNDQNRETCPYGGHDHTCRNELDRVRHHLKFKFVHRTARDFLSSTEDGRDILSASGRSYKDNCVQVIRGAIAALSIHNGDEKDPHRFENILEALTSLDDRTTDDPEQDSDLVESLRRLYEKLDLAEEYQRDFLGCMASCGRIGFVRSEVQKVSSQRYLYNLLDCTANWPAAAASPRFGFTIDSRAHWTKPELVGDILSQGADPNSCGFSPNKFFRRLERLQTPFTTFLIRTIDFTPKFEGAGSKVQYVNEVHQVIKKFLDSGVRLSDTTIYEYSTHLQQVSPISADQGWHVVTGVSIALLLEMAIWRLVQLSPGQESMLKLVQPAFTLRRRQVFMFGRFSDTFSSRRYIKATQEDSEYLLDAIDKRNRECGRFMRAYLRFNAPCSPWAPDRSEQPEVDDQSWNRDEDDGEDEEMSEIESESAGDSNNGDETGSDVEDHGVFLVGPLAARMNQEISDFINQRLHAQEATVEPQQHLASINLGPNSSQVYAYSQQVGIKPKIRIGATDYRILGSEESVLLSADTASLCSIGELLGVNVLIL